MHDSGVQHPRPVEGGGEIYPEPRDVGGPTVAQEI